MQKKKRIYAGIIMLICLLFLAGCVPGGEKKEKETKADYYIGVVSDNAPYYYEEDGTPKGYYVDFIAGLAKQASFTYEFVAVDNSSYSENLSKKAIDGFIGEAEISSEDNIGASEPFYISDICVLVPEGSVISNLKGIKDNGIASVANTQEEVFAKYLANHYKGQSVAFTSVREALSDIEAGNAQVLVVDEPYYKQHTAEFKNWKVLKASSRFQNKHRFFMQKNGKLQKVYSKGIKGLEANDGLKKIFTEF